jgi:hypothetical protein
VERQKEWRTLANLLDNQFDVLLTFDRNMRYQQNFKKYSITVLLLNAPDNTYFTLSGLTEKIKEVLTQNPTSGPIEIKA